MRCSLHIARHRRLQHGQREVHPHSFRPQRDRAKLNTLSDGRQDERSDSDEDDGGPTPLVAPPSPSPSPSSCEDGCLRICRAKADDEERLRVEVAPAPACFRFGYTSVFEFDHVAVSPNHGSLYITQVEPHVRTLFSHICPSVAEVSEALESTCASTVHVSPSDRSVPTQGNPALLKSILSPGSNSTCSCGYCGSSTIFLYGNKKSDKMELLRYLSGRLASSLVREAYSAARREEPNAVKENDPGTSGKNDDIAELPCIQLSSVDVSFSVACLVHAESKEHQRVSRAATRNSTTHAGNEPRKSPRKSCSTVASSFSDSRTLVSVVANGSSRTTPAESTPVGASDAGISPDILSQRKQRVSEEIVQHTIEKYVRRAQEEEHTRKTAGETPMSLVVTFKVRSLWESQGGGNASYQPTAASPHPQFRGGFVRVVMLPDGDCATPANDVGSELAAVASSLHALQCATESVENVGGNENRRSRTTIQSFPRTTYIRSNSDSVVWLPWRESALMTWLQEHPEWTAGEDAWAYHNDTQLEQTVLSTRRRRTPTPPFQVSRHGETGSRSDRPPHACPCHRARSRSESKIPSRSPRRMERSPPPPPAYSIDANGYEILRGLSFALGAQTDVVLCVSDAMEDYAGALSAFAFAQKARVADGGLGDGKTTPTKERLDARRKSTVNLILQNVDANVDAHKKKRSQRPSPVTGQRRNVSTRCVTRSPPPPPPPPRVAAAKVLRRTATAVQENTVRTKTPESARESHVSKSQQKGEEGNAMSSYRKILGDTLVEILGSMRATQVSHGDDSGDVEMHSRSPTPNSSSAPLLRSPTPDRTFSRPSREQQHAAPSVSNDERSVDDSTSSLPHEVALSDTPPDSAPSTPTHRERTVEPHHEELNEGTIAPQHPNMKRDNAKSDYGRTQEELVAPALQEEGESPSIKLGGGNSLEDVVEGPHESAAAVVHEKSLLEKPAMNINDLNQSAWIHTPPSERSFASTSIGEESDAVRLLSSRACQLEEELRLSREEAEKWKQKYTKIREENEKRRIYMIMKEETERAVTAHVQSLEAHLASLQKRDECVQTKEAVEQRSSPPPTEPVPSADVHELLRTLEEYRPELAQPQKIPSSAASESEEEFASFKNKNRDDSESERAKWDAERAALHHSLAVLRHNNECFLQTLRGEGIPLPHTILDWVPETALSDGRETSRQCAPKVEHSSVESCREFRHKSTQVENPVLSTHSCELQTALEELKSENLRLSEANYILHADASHLQSELLTSKSTMYQMQQRMRMFSRIVQRLLSLCFTVNLRESISTRTDGIAEDEGYEYNERDYQYRAYLLSELNRMMQRNSSTHLNNREEGAALASAMGEGELEQWLTLLVELRKNSTTLEVELGGAESDGENVELRSPLCFLLRHLKGGDGSGGDCDRGMPHVEDGSVSTVQKDRIDAGGEETLYARALFGETKESCESGEGSAAKSSPSPNSRESSRSTNPSREIVSTSLSTERTSASSNRFFDTRSSEPPMQDGGSCDEVIENPLGCRRCAELHALWCEECSARRLLSDELLRVRELMAERDAQLMWISGEMKGDVKYSIHALEKMKLRADERRLRHQRTHSRGPK